MPYNVEAKRGVIEPLFLQCSEPVELAGRLVRSSTLGPCQLLSSLSAVYKAVKSVAASG